MNTRLGRLLVITAAAMLATACATEPEMAVRPEQVTDFRELFEENCAGCHGRDGSLGVAQPLNDPLYVALISDERLTAIISRGVRDTSMTAFARDAGGTLTTEQITALVQGMRRNWGRADISPGALPPYSEDEAIARGESHGDAARGRSAFVTYCSRCHGSDGRGSRSAGSVVDPAFLALTSDQSLRTTTIVGRHSERIPGWRDYVPGRPMNNQEISDIVAWISAQRGEHD
jgi:cytochrome c oxidase cbb3-type subunit 3/ubiquinol-cytochrome c reductase cytochrome c subunit